MSKDFITIQEAADQLGKSSQTIRRMIKRGDLNAKRIRTPQGFHYVIASDSIGLSPVLKKPNPPKIEKETMLDKTIVEKSIEAESPAEKLDPTSQSEVLINQQPERPQTKAINETFDKNDMTELMNRHHRETMMMIGVIQKLQHELDKERRRPKSFLAYFFDWLSH